MQGSHRDDEENKGLTYQPNHYTQVQKSRSEHQQITNTLAKTANHTHIPFIQNIAFTFLYSQI